MTVAPARLAREPRYAGGMHDHALPCALMRLSSVVLVLLASACAKPATPQARVAAAPTLADDVARLVLPVPRSPAFQEDIAAALARLETRAESTSASADKAAWARAHYLLDLFDDARLRRDGESLAMLHRALDTPPDAPRQGPAATDTALQALAVALDGILARDRLHAEAQAARTLVGWDLDRPRERAAVHGRLEAVKAIARGGSDVAANARLRLHAYCRQALEDVRRARRADRTRIAAHCLYPLYTADPAPYFAEEPATRPPPPDWRALLADLDRLLGTVIEHPGRLSVTAQALRSELADLEPVLASALPAPPDPVALGLPRVDHGPPYDDTPLLTLDASAAADQLEALRSALVEDGRNTATAVIPAVAPAAQVLDAAERAAGAGAAQLGLLAWNEQAVALRAGDYWSAHAPPSGRARRLVAIPLSLARLGSSASPSGASPSSASPSGASPSGASPSGASPSNTPAPARPAAPVAAPEPGLGLHLVIDRETWRLTSPTGEVAALATSSETGDPVEGLRAALARVRSAFATPQTLVLVPGREATAGALVTAAAAALAPHQDQPLVAGLALARSAPAPRVSTLAQRIARRASASVDIAPAELAARSPIVRACYQDVLDARPAAAGTVRLERRGTGLVVTGPADRGLRACAENTLGPVMRERDITSATTTFRPQVRP